MPLTLGESVVAVEVAIFLILHFRETILAKECFPGLVDLLLREMGAGLKIGFGRRWGIERWLEVVGILKIGDEFVERGVGFLPSFPCHSSRIVSPLQHHQIFQTFTYNVVSRVFPGFICVLSSSRRRKQSLSDLLNCERPKAKFCPAHLRAVLPLRGRF